MHLFKIKVVANQFVDIVTYLKIDCALDEWTIVQKKQLVTRATNYQLIVEKLYKLGAYGILCRCVMDHERQEMLHESHVGVTGGHYVRKETMQKVLHTGLWWPSLFQDAAQYYKVCDVCQRIGNPSHHDEMLMYHMIN